MQKLIFQFILSASVYCHGLIGGTPADSATFPTSVIHIQNGCTASLIASNKILLAAHCVLPFQNTWLHHKDSSIKFHRSAVASDSVAIEAVISRIDIHPEWLRMIQTGKNMNQFLSNKETVDLAVLTLRQMSKKVSSHFIIPLNFNPMSKGDEVLIGGYGCETLHQPNRNPRYKYAWKSISKINGNQFLTDSKNLRSNERSIPCEGDSGGPVFTRTNNRFSIIGVNSYVQQTSNARDFTTGHVQLAYFQDWLLNALKR